MVSFTRYTSGSLPHLHEDLRVIAAELSSPLVIRAVDHCMKQRKMAEAFQWLRRYGTRSIREQYLEVRLYSHCATLS